ncbi:MAG: septum formation inhibitor Maf [Proteobacteria bacterium]|nr:septum formation inhibitor Maf [Pseudomonadota bacterium]
MAKFIFTSKSQNNAEILKGLGYDYDFVEAQTTDTALKAEKPRDFAVRIAVSQAKELENSTNILSAYSVCAMGRKILCIPEDKRQAFDFIKMLSGKSHRVYTCVCLLKADGSIKTKVVETRVKIRPLSCKEIESYVANEQNWQNFAGGYSIAKPQGSALIKSIVGSPSSITGLPLYETECLLKLI